MKGLSAAAAVFVAHGRVARLGTVDGRGQPLVVPVCYVFDGLCWYSAIDGKPKRGGRQPLRRIRNIAENPRVSVLVDHYDEDWTRLRYVVLEGAATVLSGGGEFSRAVELLRAKYPQYATVPVGGEGQVVIRVTPDSFVEWSFAA